MKKSHARPRRRAPAAPPPAPQPPTPAASTLERAAAQIRAAVPDIVQAMIDQAKEGSCPHAKFIFEVGGVALAAPPDEQPQSLLALLLERLPPVSGSSVG